MSEPSDIPIVGAPRGPVLMSAENPTGWKLEELLPVLCEELHAKNARIEGDLSNTAATVRANNVVVIVLLAHAGNVQRETLRCLDALGPDRGPLGGARIGAGARREPASS